MEVRGTSNSLKHSEGADCDVEQGPSISVRCALPDEGTYRVVLFSNRKPYGTYQQVGEIEALRGGGH